MDRYEARMNLHGNTARDRNIWRLKNNILLKAKDNPSYKGVKLNGTDTSIIINSGTAPYYKTFQALPGQKILPGDYVEWKDNIWLVYTADADDEVYIDGDLRQCNYKMFWQKDDGTITSRHAWVQNASAYNSGEEGNNYITLQSNQFMVYLPYDEETELLQNGKRVNMSRSNICKPYKLTRPDEISYGYSEKGVLNIIFTQDQFNESVDKLVELEDGKKVWICDYHSPTDVPTEPESPEESQNITASISGNKSLKVGFERTYTAIFKDKDGNIVDNQKFDWNIVSDFNVESQIESDKIKLLVDDEDYISSSFLLQLVMDNKAVSELEITVVEAF